MREAHASLAAVDPLLELAVRLEAHEGFSEVMASLRAGHGATSDGVWGSSCALAAAAIKRHAPELLLIVCPHQGDIDGFCDDLSLFTRERIERFAAAESESREALLLDDVYGDRLRVLKDLMAGGSSASPLLVTSIQSLLQPVPDRATLTSHTREVRVGSEIQLRDFLAWLVEQGLQNTSAVELPGEFAVRGGIVDVFAPDWRQPVRIELFGDEITSLRRFEIANQRSLAELESVDVTLIPPTVQHRDHLASFLPNRSWILLVDLPAIEEEGRHYLERLQWPQEHHAMADVLQQVYRFPSITAAAIAAGSMETTCRLKTESVERFSGDIARVRHELDTTGAGQDVFIICPTDAEAQRLGDVLGETKLAADGKLHFHVGRLQAGFRLISERIVLVSSGELFQRVEPGRPSRRRLGRALDSFLDLRPGDYIVHLAHGIGRYRGLKLLEKEQRVEEHLELEFDGGTKIYVPATKIELVQKYIGGSKSRPALAKIGGRSWIRQKLAVQQAVSDMAGEMLELQAAQASRPGIAFPEDSAWQREFDAAFPYEETPDQLVALTAIKRDMRQSRPMDRLLCGDVGFGKTELAIRAAFKAVDAGYQVAVLVPTTILAEQHQRTFAGRMAEFPFVIAALSRFATRKGQTRVIEGLRSGAIDVVIGTHRLAQSDVEFHNLGLVIIDEEQRFGVEVKERLKMLRQTVDVLTMTATPIPRTLHMSLLGVRDISNLETPPDDRLAVETRVARFDDELVRHAVLRELNRDGQIFFVHNRIEDIELVASRLRRIVPEARLAIAHGQMPEGELEQVMVDFVQHRCDLLMATTIVESGLDIPNANTIFIDEADRYGLADLHQLRGRVGRYKHRAYCYLLVDPRKHLSPTAARRLKAIEEFSQMGAGFAIAMRDLEIRGAGNILGTQQSGHIALVGYELYCSLLEQAVRRLKHLPPRSSIEVNIDLPGEAHIPRSYVGDMRLKIDLYRRLARVSSEAELADLSAELTDRFGPPPLSVQYMLSRAETAIWAHTHGIESIHMEPDYLVFQYTSRVKIEELVGSSGKRLRVVDDHSAYLPIGKDVADTAAIHKTVKSLLQPAGGDVYNPAPR